MTNGGRDKGSRRGSGRKGRRAGRAGERSPRGADDRPRAFGLGPVNLALLVAAVAAIVAGYVLLDRGSITAAPLLLVLGYAVLIPAGLLFGWGRSGERER